MLNYILQRISSGRKILLSHYLTPKLLLVIKSINYINKETIVFDEKQYLIKTNLIEKLRNNTLVSNKLITPPEKYRVIYIEPSRFPWKISNKDILVTLTPGTYRFKIPTYYEKIYLNKLGENLYELYIRETLERFRIRIGKNKLLYEEKPYGLLGEAYEILRKTLLEYGELRVKDALNILVFELGISKEKAREILSKLVIEKYIRVEKGSIIVY